MKTARFVAIATWVLEHLTFGSDNQALCGDLLEEHRRGRSVAWFLRQVVSAIVLGACRWAGGLALPLVYAAVWTMLYPAWRIGSRSALVFTAPDRWTALAWPYSSLMELCIGVVPAVTFVWLGFLLYLLLRPEIARELLSRQILWSLSASLNVLLVATVALLNHMKQPWVDLLAVTRDDFYSIFHLANVSVPLALSLLAALWPTLTQGPRIARRKRLAHGQISGDVSGLGRAV
jgi:hypothetical protein